MLPIQTKVLAGQIHSQIQDAHNVLLLTHEDPDIDALSSAFSFSHYLDSLKKNHTVYLREVPTGMYDEILERHPYVTDLSHDALKNFSLIIIFDSGDLRHTGIEEHLLSLRNNILLFNIDHHPTNTHFGAINLVSPEAASTTEIIFHYFENINFALTKTQSALLLAGILGDTNNFTNHNTTSGALRAASQLLKYGINIKKISDIVRPKRNTASLKGWGEIFSRLSINKKYGIALTVITKEDLENFENKSEIFRGISNYLNNVSGVRLSVVLKETPDGVIRVSMRSNDDLLDLSKFVKIFNGGGHQKAAGFSIHGRLEKTEKGWRVI